ncbi:MAG TPA: alpha/beta fold hydrolase [Gemmatimonadales bacterium]|nr:alpha/beta fold hydrolase [Gemmatimonadales bacterium]
MPTASAPHALPPDDDPAARTAAHHPVATAQMWAIRTAFATAGRVAPAAAARWAETLFCRPPRHEPRTRDHQFLAAGRRYTLVKGEAEVAAWEWGQGPLVLLVHGWGSRAGRFSTFGPALVEAGFRVVAHDAPAHGQSSGTEAALPLFADALRVVGRHFGPAAAVVGHSLGGAATVLALRDGLRAERAMLISTPSNIEIFSHRFARFFGVPERVREIMQSNLERRFQMAWADVHTAGIARSLPQPGLVVHDRDDTDVPLADARAIANAWAGAQLIVTKGLGHRGVLRSSEVVHYLIDFLRQ